MFPIIAIIFFALEIAGVHKGWLMPAGLLCIAAALLVGNWPVGYFRRE